VSNAAKSLFMQRLPYHPSIISVPEKVLWCRREVGRN
jgi:hypothetical protein